MAASAREGLNSTSSSSTVQKKNGSKVPEIFSAVEKDYSVNFCNREPHILMLALPTKVLVHLYHLTALWRATSFPYSAIALKVGKVQPKGRPAPYSLIKF